MICETTHIGQLPLWMICTTTHIGDLPLWMISTTTHIGQLPLWMICTTTHIGQFVLLRDLSSPDSLANEVQLLLNEIRKPVNNSNGGAKEQIVSTEDSGSVETGDHFPANKVQHLLDELQRPVNNSNLGTKEQIVSTKDCSSGEAGDHLPATDIGGREVVPASDSKGGGGEDVVSPSSEGGNVPVNHRNGSEGGGDVPVNGTSVEDNSWEREHVRQLTHHHLSVSSDQVCTRNVMCPLADMRRGCCVLYSRCR